MRRRSVKTPGFITVLVLCIVVIISVVLVAFSRRVQAFILSTESLKHSLQAEANAQAGLNIALAMIKNDPNNIRQFYNSADSKNLLDLQNGQCQLIIQPENSKINLNKLIDENGRPNEPVINHLARLIRIINDERIINPIDYSVIPNVVDWIDPDEDITKLALHGRTFTGAESDYYLRQPLSYKAKNAPLSTTKELLYIKGFSNSILSELSPYITIRGCGKIDINSAPTKVLKSMSDKIFEDVVEEIIARRNLEPFSSICQLKEVPGITDEVFSTVSDRITVEPEEIFYRITSKGTVGDYKKTLTVTVAAQKNGERTDLKIIEYDERNY